MENNARLLLLSGNSICFTFLASKAVNGRAAELARLMVFMALVSTTQHSLFTPKFAVSGWKIFPTLSHTPGINPARSWIFHPPAPCAASLEKHH